VLFRSVTPDISLPSAGDDNSFGESSYDNALPWMQIGAAEYQPVGNLGNMLSPLKSRHDARVAKSKEFQYLLEDIAEFKEHRKIGTISLNLAERRKERDTREAREKTREKSSNGHSHLMRDDGLQANERSLNDELAAEKARKENKDIMLDESGHILSDEVDLLKTDERLAASSQPAH
jgi:carboxyl-terminal processing protease